VAKFSGCTRIGIVVRDHEVYVHAPRSMTRMGYLEPAATKALVAFQAIFSQK